MSVNLIELLKEQIGSQVASQSSRFLGEEESKVSTSLDLILPALLGGFMKNKANEGLYNSAKDTEDGILENLKSLFAGGPSTTNLMNSGDVIIKTIIGDKFNSLLNVISTETGLKKGSASSLLRMIAPLMLHAIGKKIREENLDFAGYQEFLSGQDKMLKEKTPSSMSFYMGYNDNTAEGASVSTSNPNKITKWAFFVKLLRPIIIPAIVILGLLWTLLYCFQVDDNDKINEPYEKVERSDQQGIDTAKKGQEKVKEGVTDLANDAKDVTEDAEDAEDEVDNAIKGTYVALSDATKATIAAITFTKGSVGEQIAEIISTETGVGKITRFNQLTFASGSSKIDPSTQKEIDDLAALLEAVPTMHIQVGGHTDNTGNPTDNLELSQVKAKAVKKRLINNGIDASRVKAKGFGQIHPKASNQTEEGRSKNRRIEVKITKR